MAQQFIVNGRVTDAQTEEILSDVNVVDKKSVVGVTLDAYGLYTIRLNSRIVSCKLQCWVTKSLSGILPFLSYRLNF